jgi:radical SAM superfamily enzyme YgiQ (UPF0313 family)
LIFEKKENYVIKDKKPLNIYLADLANDLFEIDNKSIPIGVGYVGAYCKGFWGSDVNLKLFRTAAPLLDEILKNSPHIIGFGSYDWNYNLTLAVARKVKEVCPGVVVVMGGANVDADPVKNREFLEANPCIDLLVFGDGELPFAEIVRRCLEGGDVRSVPIDGARFLYEGELVMGEAMDAVEEPDSVPSPYLSGMLDGFLTDERLVPVLQKVRGCPFSCSFCVSGNQKGRMRSFSAGRVMAEIDYLRNHAANRMIRFADDNFGIFKDDLEVARHLDRTHREHGYPVGLRVYTSKKLNGTTRELTLALKDLSLMNISFQSINPAALANIKRSMPPMVEISNLLSFARANNIPTGTELILGLPGETLESVKAMIDKVMELKFDSVSIVVLWLLRGTELSKSRGQYGFKSKFMLAENAVSMVDGEISFEEDELAVSSNTYSFEDYRIFLKYLFICDFSIASGYAKELLFHGISFGVKPSAVFDEMLLNSDLYPVINKTTDGFLKHYLAHMFDSREELGVFVRENIDGWVKHKESITSISKCRMVQEFVADMLFKDPELKVLSEFEGAINVLFPGEDRELFYSLTKHM